MPEPSGVAKDAKTEGAIPKPLTASRLAVLCVAGLVGGVVGAVGLGLVVSELAGHTRGMSEWTGSLLAILGAVLGLPLGTAAGLRIAGRKLGIRGRFWPVLGTSYAGILAWLGLLGLLRYLVIRGHIPTAVVHYQPFLLYAGPFVLSLVGGLVGYLGGRPRHPDDTAGNT